MTQKLSEITKGNYPEDFYYAVKKYVEEWESLTEKMKEIQGQLKIQAESEKDIHQIYESVPGIGLIHESGDLD